MSHVMLARIWKVGFGLTLAALFSWYCHFWIRHFFVPESLPFAAAAAPFSPIAPAPSSAHQTDRVCTEAPKLPIPHAKTLDAAQVDDGAASFDLASRAFNRMVQGRIYGPYAPSVRDGLNEMVIGTTLLAQGVAFAADPAAGLSGVLRAIPAQLPTYGYISSGFGMRRSPFTGRYVHHKGIDFAVPHGAPVYATADGVVTFAGWYYGLGRAIMIDHGYGIVTKYGHNSRNEVKAGDRVRRGDVIARAGSTGRSTGPHVHYEVWLHDKPIDPGQFMFDVPDRPAEASVQQVAMDYSDSAHHLGLGTGGDDEAAPPTRKKLQGQDSKASLLLNLAIVGVFAFFALVTLVAQWPGHLAWGRDGLS